MRSIDYVSHSCLLILLVFAVFILISLPGCKESPSGTDPAVTTDQYTIEQAISDEAQKNTISFDGLAFLKGNLGSQSFLPPGKVADYSGFQCLRDNDPTKMGHNTDFVTIIAFNVLHILTTDQINMFVESALDQVNKINEFAYYRFPLLKAFRRLEEGDLPAGTTGLNKEAVMNYTAELYKLDGEISYNRAKLFGKVISSLTAAQRASLDALKALNGIGNWNKNLPDPLQSLNLPPDVNVAVMTYASEIYSWYAGSVKMDTYFCPERHGTYFGSFYLKDWPAMGNPNYTIDETLTASAGQNFLNVLTSFQRDQITGIVEQQRSDLLEIVTTREVVSAELRNFLNGKSVDSLKIITLSQRYGQLDGEISYYYAAAFTKVYNSLSDQQRSQVTALADQLGYIDPEGAFLYSKPIPMPGIIDTDFFFN